MRIERRLGIRSAYGQLVLIVFLPIAILASVGAVLVFSETKRALKSEQDTLAQAALIRYEPIIRPLLPNLKVGQTPELELEEVVYEMAINGVNQALLPSNQRPNIGQRYTTSQLYRIGSEQNVLRVGILDNQGQQLLGVGHNREKSWGEFDPNAERIWRLKTDKGTAYGMPLTAIIDGRQQKFWLMVDMDNEPIVIAYYRVLLALAITGLITILLLLLILSIYSKRWITPIYELRLFLQKLQPHNLDKTLNLQSDGEFYLLQQEINYALKRMHNSFQELKRHSEQTEADLQQAFDEMEMQTISVRRTNNLLKHTSDAKSAFLANISHELRTPLNAIDGFINLLARSELDSKHALYVQTIKKSSAHLLALINDVLDFSKMEAGKLTLENQPLNLYHSVLEVADMLSPTAYEKGLRMAVLFYHDVPTTIMGDKLRIKQILMNLLGNALKFTDTGDVVIQVELSEKNTIRLMITDSGRGIDKSAGEQLFEGFNQGDASITRRYGGTGLGLMISKQLTHLMQGEIGFFDNANENIAKSGSTFWVELPMPQDDEWDDEPFGVNLQKTGQMLAWINHEPAQKSLKMALAGSKIVLSFADSLAKLLDELSKPNRPDYEWVIVDSHAQKGDLTALLGQVRRYYDGQLFVYGYQVGFDDSLTKHHAYGLYEPLDKGQLYELIEQKSTQSLDNKDKAWFDKVALIVDDYAPNLLVLEALLSEFGIQSIQAQSGFDAIEIMSDDFAKGGVIDLIFMDISMPVMSGIEACRAIRRLEGSLANAKKTPIIALTAHGLPDDDSEIVKAGLSDYAQKPLAEYELLHLLQKWLPTSEGQAQSVPADLPKPSTPKPLMPIKSNQTNTAIIDVADALSRAGGKLALAQKLLDLLIQDLPNEKEKLQNAWKNKDLKSLMDNVHRLLGATRYTGVPCLREALEVFYGECNTLGDDVWQDDGRFLAVVENIDDIINAMTDNEVMWHSN